MRARPALLCLLVLSVVAAVLAAVRPATAQDPTPPPHPRIAGWSAGDKAAQTADMLQANDPVPLALPPFVAAQVTGPTALFYFSPSCPHCQHVMPEVNALVGKAGISWLGIATSRADATEIAAFAKDYAAAFPLISDEGGAFARSVGARSTPIVLLVEPAPAGAGPAVNAAMVSDGTVVHLTEGYQPFSRGLGPVVLLRSHLDDPFADFEGFQGDLVCSTCHVHEARSMALTHHSVAYRTLYTRERTDEAECVSCHVTGMGAGGFTLGDHGSPFTDVGCEACHGPSGPHDGQADDARAACVGCHDAEHSVAFSLDKGLPHIDHFKSVHMTDDQMMARVQALGSGEADKPLLAFPDGPTVGAQACAGCHPAQAKWHAKADPHPGAMRHLSGDQAHGEGCVSCHATPTAMSSMAPPDPAKPDAWRASEGVGCESCHGPGGEHAKAPAKGNIVGLGDSCPECVIEAICTSCHTEAWDPEWELQARLEAIDH